MSSKLTTSRFGSFFGIGNKHSAKRAASQKEPVGGFRDAQQTTPPSDCRALNDAVYLDIPHNVGGRGLPVQNASTVPESQQTGLQKRHYHQSLYTLPDADPFAATSPIALPISPNPRSPSDYNTFHSPPTLLIQAQSDTSVPVPSPFGSPIDHGQNASG